MIDHSISHFYFLPTTFYRNTWDCALERVSVLMCAGRGHILNEQSRTRITKLNMQKYTAENYIARDIGNLESYLQDQVNESNQGRTLDFLKGADLFSYVVASRCEESTLRKLLIILQASSVLPHSKKPKKTDFSYANRVI